MQSRASLAISVQLAVISTICMLCKCDTELLKVIEVFVVRSFTPETCNLDQRYLSANGMRRHHNLGVVIKNAYPELFSRPLHTGTVPNYKLYQRENPYSSQAAQSHALGLTGYDGVKITVDSQRDDVLQPPFGKWTGAGDDALPNSFMPLYIKSAGKGIEDIFMEMNTCPYFEEVSFMKYLVLKDGLLNTTKHALNAYIKEKAGLSCRSVCYDPILCIEGKDTDFFTLQAIHFINKVDYSTFLSTGTWKLESLPTEVRSVMQLISPLFTIARLFPDEIIFKAYSSNILKHLSGSVNSTSHRYVGYTSTTKDLLGILIAMNWTSLECIHAKVDKAIGLRPDVNIKSPCISDIKDASNLIIEVSRANSDPKAPLIVKFKIDGEPLLINGTESTDENSLYKLVEPLLLTPTQHFNLCERKIADETTGFKNTHYLAWYSGILLGSTVLSIFVLYIVYLKNKANILAVNYHQSLREPVINIDIPKDSNANESISIIEDFVTTPVNESRDMLNNKAT